jgi:hypothetical protein
VRLKSKDGRDALGARVACRVGEMSRVDEVCGGDGYLSVSDRCVRVGLPANGSAKLDVRWPDGTRQAVDRLTPGEWLLSEGAAPAAMLR